jgi:NAD-dependent SIR2 family protein deacetylase
LKPAVRLYGDEVELHVEDDGSHNKLGDLNTVQLLLVVGTALSVRPAADVVSGVEDGHRLIVDKSPCPPRAACVRPGHPESRDSYLEGDADQVFSTLIRDLGWE